MQKKTKQIEEAALCALLSSAFPARPIPASALADRGLNWVEREGAAEYEAGVIGQRWDAIEADFIEAHGNAPTFLGGAALREVLPAYLRYLVEHEVYDDVPYAIAVALTRKSDPRRAADFDETFGALTDAQRWAVRQVLEVLGQREPTGRVMRRALESFWVDVPPPRDGPVT